MPTHEVSVVRDPVVSGDVPAQGPDQNECQDAREKENDGHTVADGKPVHLSKWEGGGGAGGGAEGVEDDEELQECLHTYV